MVPNARTAETSHMRETSGSCPTCQQGDLIAISMTVGDRDLSFSTCHLCEAKWWYQDGERVPLTSVIDLVVKR
jgi:uncharacterized protein (DUF983 family)